MTQDEIKQAWEESTGSCWPDEGCFTAGEYDYNILAFAQLVRNAALEEAAMRCDIAGEPEKPNLAQNDEQWGATMCAERIRNLKS